MASSGKRKTTMAKLTRERKLVERRIEKRAKKQARKDAAADPAQAGDGMPGMTDETSGMTDDETSGMTDDETSGMTDETPEPTVEPAAGVGAAPGRPGA